MQQRPIGNRTVSAIGLGEMPLSIEGRPDRAQAIATIHASLDAGRHHHRHRRRLLAGRARARPRRGAGGRGAGRLRRRRPTTSLVATKGGHRRPGDGSWTVHGDPAYVKQACEASLKRLGVDAIGLYQYHRPDPKVPWAESVGALADLLDEGKILMAGVSNATVAQIDEAQRVLGGRLVSVQNEFSPRFRSSEGELEHCEKLGHRLHPLEPARGHRATPTDRAEPPGLRRGGRRGGRQPPAGHPGLDAGQGLPGHPDPRQQPARDRRSRRPRRPTSPSPPSRWPASTPPDAADRRCGTERRRGVFAQCRRDRARAHRTGPSVPEVRDRK